MLILKGYFPIWAILTEKEKYMDIKKLFEDNFSGDICISEYHALLFEQGRTAI